jgi:ferrous iron transport protein B
MKFDSKPEVALIGNPNCGKTTLFNQITGLNKKTGNWSGVTVDTQFCAVNYDQLDYHLIDLPGIYALSLEGQGQDEVHVQDFLQNQPPNLIINVINSSSLERGLFMTVELLEYGVPVITVLNMWDEALTNGIAIDIDKLSKKLNSAVLPMIAKTGEGVDELLKLINLELNSNTAISPLKINYKESIASQISPFIKEGSVPAVALKQCFNALNEDDKETFEENVFSDRFNTAHAISSKVQHKDSSIELVSSRLDKWTTHPVFGLLSFFVAMYVMFFFAINVSAIFVDFFDLSTHAILINGGHQLFEYLHVPKWLAVILADGIGGGIQTVATFIPVIGFLYLVLTWLEDSGYMSRAAFVMNGLMQKIGLSGQAFVPLIVSFGCNVPAIAATRTLPSRRERLITIMMAPFMSCGARLSVYALFVAAFFTEHATLIVFSLYFIGIFVAVLTGLLLRKTLLPGKAEPFLIELPPWRVPTIKNLLIGTWNRLKGFLLDAGKIIIIMVMIIQILSSVGKDFSWGNEDSENSMLSVAAKAFVPVFKPMGIEEKNWPALVGILTGVLAKEVVVGTLDAIYTSLDNNNNEEEPLSIKEELIASVVSIKDNAIGLGDLLLDPLGLSITSQGSKEEMAENQAVSRSLFGILKDKFSDTYSAFAYLLFILLYFPCVAATAAIAREAGIKWAIFSGVWSTGLAYMISCSFYQVVHWQRNPVFASSWLVVFVVGLIAVYFYLKKLGNAK